MRSLGWCRFSPVGASGWRAPMRASGPGLTARSTRTCGRRVAAHGPAIRSRPPALRAAAHTRSTITTATPWPPRWYASRPTIARTPLSRCGTTTTPIISRPTARATLWTTINTTTEAVPRSGSTWGTTSRHGSKRGYCSPTTRPGAASTTGPTAPRTARCSTASIGCGERAPTCASTSISRPAPC